MQANLVVWLWCLHSIAEILLYHVASSEPVGLGQGARRGLQFLQRSEGGECRLFPM